METYEIQAQIEALKKGGLLPQHSFSQMEERPSSPRRRPLRGTKSGGKLSSYNFATVTLALYCSVLTFCCSLRFLPCWHLNDSMSPLTTHVQGHHPLTFPVLTCQRPEAGRTHHPSSLPLHLWLEIIRLFPPIARFTQMGRLFESGSQSKAAAAAWLSLSPVIFPSM